VLLFAVSLAASVTDANARKQLTIDDLNDYASTYGLVTNDAFLPEADAKKALEPFSGTVSIEESLMFTHPEKLKKDIILGKDPRLFPQVSISFITVDGDLVPSTQDVIRSGSLQAGKSYWDIIVQPGKVWSEPADNGWSRASFPFALMNSIEGETHNGVAAFLYKEGKISGIRYQILQQTSPFYVEDYFTASGTLKASFLAGDVPDHEAIKDRFTKAEAATEKVLDWKSLENEVGAAALEGFNSTIAKGETVVDGIVFNGKLYLKSCDTTSGTLPYCDRQRFGVWSVTKSAATTSAMLRLAEKYGPSVFKEKISDYVKPAQNRPGWENVTFGDALNMATGVGYGSDQSKQNSIFEPFEDAYYRWYEARSADEKLNALLDSAKPYPWGPGKIARYRDEDIFILGIALTEYIKAKEGPNSDIWSFLTSEVFEPIGIYYAPTNKTIEPDDRNARALMAFGFYPTVSDLVKIAHLYQEGGKHKEKQILNAQELAGVMPSAKPIGLSTGDAHMPMYDKGFWHADMKSKSGCSFSFAVMDGWGKNYVMLFPKGITVIRLAKNWDGAEGAARLDSMTQVVDRMTDLCR
jgi:CubicO group peptidase (beta-lactamase class C family)